MEDTNIHIDPEKIPDVVLSSWDDQTHYWSLEKGKYYKMYNLYSPDVIIYARVAVAHNPVESGVYRFSIDNPKPVYKSGTYPQNRWDMVEIDKEEYEQMKTVVTI